MVSDLITYLAVDLHRIGRDDPVLFRRPQTSFPRPLHMTSETLDAGSTEVLAVLTALAAADPPRYQVGLRIRQLVVGAQFEDDTRTNLLVLGELVSARLEDGDFVSINTLFQSALTALGLTTVPRPVVALASQGAECFQGSATARRMRLIALAGLPATRVRFDEAIAQMEACEAAISAAVSGAQAVSIAQVSEDLNILVFLAKVFSQRDQLREWFAASIEPRDTGFEYLRMQFEVMRVACAFHENDTVHFADANTKYQAVVDAMLACFANDYPILQESALEFGQRLAAAAGDSKAAASRWWSRVELFGGGEHDQLSTADNHGMAAAHQLHRALALLQGPPPAVEAATVRSRFEAVKRRLVAANRAAVAGMRSHRFLATIPPEAYASRLEFVRGGTTAQDKIHRLLQVLYAPDLERISQDVREILAETIAWRIAPAVYIGEGGRPAGFATDENVHGIEENRRIQLEAEVFAEQFFGRVRREWHQTSVVTAEDILGAFSTRRLVDSRRMRTLADGLGHWLEGRSNEAVHLLVPEIERTLRLLATVAGGDTLAAKGDRFHHIALENLIAESQASFLPDSIATLFRVVLTERGRNIRNAVCHGFAHDMWATDSDLVVMSLLHLLAWEIRPVE